MRLALPAAADLFRAPEQDPLAGQFSTRSGMDLLTEQVDPRPSERLRIELDLGVPYPEDSLRTAVAGYCEERIGRIDVQREAIQRRGRKELVVGLTFLAGCLAAGVLLSAAQAGPYWLRTFLSEGLVIVGWIALWHPVDMLFFERLPLVRETRVLRRIAEADIVVTAATRD
ncbi:MAG TPA: hypothetical protein PLA49_07275 [Propioniciclava sp.]|uniref:hypothetical protein n=1 Tax=Propioniciclava sp. TaxID=2038686 RepID=UPI002C2DE31D|nr:hypothetical protein [Propioniciclava sp.]HRL49168.1 hypothetical protein [Propioniciclava sp.]